MKPDMETLALMTVANELWDTACVDYSEGEEPSLVRARLALHAAAIAGIRHNLENE